MIKKSLIILIFFSLSRFHAYGDEALDSYEFKASVQFGVAEDEPEYIQEARAVIGPSGGVVELSEGSYIRIPSGALDEEKEIIFQKLDIEHPSFVDFKPPEKSEAAEAKSLYRFLPEDLNFKRPATLHLLAGDYPHNNYNYKIFKRDKLFDEWDLRGGRMKIENSKVYVRANTGSFSIYSIYPVEGLEASDLRPKDRIVTRNTSASFRGIAAQDTTIRIFDMRGREIRSISKNNDYEWDGTDEGGRFVESGVYIYQFKAEIDGSDELVSGMIAVAR